MRTVIAGGRDYHLTHKDYQVLEWLKHILPITEVVSGTARGADIAGEFWAQKQGLDVTQFPADWEQHGNRAGPIRNDKMAKFAQAVVLFPGGRGTDNMARAAERHGCVVFDYRQGIPECLDQIKKPSNSANKLTAEKVRDIRKRLANGAKLGEVAGEYGVSKMSVYKIKERVTWTDV